MVAPYIKDNQLTYDDFDYVFGKILIHRDQYTVVEFLENKGIHLVDVIIPSKEAIDNLIKNAIEHGAKQITVNGTYNKLYTHLEIIDNGDGIDEKDINHIFERFYKAKNSRSESLGLGLAFTKSIIQNQDGTIKVISNKGEGTKFIIEI